MVVYCSICSLFLFSGIGLWVLVVVGCVFMVWKCVSILCVMFGVIGDLLVSVRWIRFSSVCVGWFVVR